MPPSNTKTTVMHKEEVFIRKRVLSLAQHTSEEDHKNNNKLPEDEFKIHDINYLTSNAHESPTEEAKADYSNWKAEIRYIYPIPICFGCYLKSIKSLPSLSGGPTQ